MTCLLPSSPNWFCSGVSAVDGHDLLAFGSRYQVVLLDLSTRLCVGILYGHTNRVTCVCFLAANHQLASGSEDCSVRIWDYETRTCKAVISEASPITCIAPLQGALLCCGSAGGQLLVCDLSTKQSRPCNPFGDTGSSGGKSGKGGKAGKGAKGGKGGKGGGKGVGECGAATALAVCPSSGLAAVGFETGRLAVARPGGAAGGRAEAWAPLNGHIDAIQGLAWQPPHGDGDSVLASASRDKTVRLWAVTLATWLGEDGPPTPTAQCLQVITLPREPTPPGPNGSASLRNRSWNCVAFHPEAPHLLLTGANSLPQLCEWDVGAALRREGPAPLKVPPPCGAFKGDRHKRCLFGVHFYRDRRTKALAIVTHSMDRTIIGWDYAKRAVQWRMPTLGAAANCMDLNLLGNALACGVGTEILVWHPTKKEDPYDHKVLWKGITAKVTAVAFHPLHPTTLAFGMSSGALATASTVGNNAQPPEPFHSSHRKAVYVLQWLPGDG
eukprot:EG_transcript_10660